MYMLTMKPITQHVPQPDLDAIEALVKAGLYPNRAEFIRLAIKQVLKEEMRGQPNHE
jgi:Arc/MetJ-type ribon-helix-helix transcriptional regulator